jgi:hypothetical protein
MVYQKMQSQHNKWIVITTIQKPTPALKKIAQKCPEWQLLVVGDEKTPDDWHLDDHCIYLSPSDQKKLPYSLCKLLPFNHYARKNIGYLYAIAHGAQIIYETDDDNYIIDTIKIFRNNDNIALLSSKNFVINVYHYFGQEKAWPRGYPLAHIKNSDNYYIEPFKNNGKIIIEQGLVDKDPDLDALFRLTYHQELFFNEAQRPCVLADNIFSPFNTQNTLFHYEAFYGLYIPAYVPFRTCDIWRGYITQRLMQETGHKICFTPPTAIQERNVHNYMQDFEEEIDLYLKSHLLLQLLNDWKAPGKNILDNMKDLYSYLIQNNFFEKQEEPLISAWIDDITCALAAQNAI